MKCNQNCNEYDKHIPKNCQIKIRKFNKNILNRPIDNNP